MDDVSAPTTYTFGDSDVAVARLAIVDELFGDATAAFLGRWAPPRPAVALDLGCGPGFTTVAVGRACGPQRLVGIDASAAMVASARERLGAHRRPGDGARDAMVHDVTALPLPEAPVDLVHARYLLAHLPGPRAALDGWCTQLTTGGRLLLDELERIDTTVPTFVDYLDTVTAMIAAQGAAMYAGPLIAGHVPPGCRVLVDETVVLPQPTTTVARMFAMNLSVWRHDPWVLDHVDPAVPDRLAADLTTLAASPDDGAGSAVWTHRRMVVERNDP